MLAARGFDHPHGVPWRRRSGSTCGSRTSHVSVPPLVPVVQKPVAQHARGNRRSRPHIRTVLAYLRQLVPGVWAMRDMFRLIPDGASEAGLAGWQGQGGCTSSLSSNALGTVGSAGGTHDYVSTRHHAAIRRMGSGHVYEQGKHGPKQFMPAAAMTGLWCT